MSGETGGLTVRAKLKLRRGPKGRKRVTSVPVETEPTPDVEPVPRIARLMALAIVMDQLVRTRQVESYAEIARMLRLGASCTVTCWPTGNGGGLNGNPFSVPTRVSCGK